MTKKMPRNIDLGRHGTTTMGQAIHQRNMYARGEIKNPRGLRVVMGYLLPEWQRDAVWSREQQIKFLESAWSGLNLGTYTYNYAKSFEGKTDYYLVDGQQRLMAVEAYLNDEFPVYGLLYSELDVSDRRRFDSTVIFSSFQTETDDEDYLKNYYNLTNFGGTAHKENERA